MRYLSLIKPSQGGAGTSCHLDSFKRMWNDRDRKDFVTCGAAAGVAAAFRSPVGGVLFALEEMSSWWSNDILWHTFFTTAGMELQPDAPYMTGYTLTLT